MNQPTNHNLTDAPQTPSDEDTGAAGMSGGHVIEHLIELRQRLLLSFVALIAMTGLCYMFSDHIFAILIKPLAEVMGPNATHRLIYTSLTEAFFTTLKVSFLSALFLTMPVILTQIWKFVAPGLYRRERKAFLPFFIATPLLFTAGAAIVYFIVMPLAWSFFLGFQTNSDQTVLPIQLEARIADYLDLIISLIFAFGLCFQLPVVLTLMARAGIITSQSLTDKRKYMIVAAFIIGAALTPPDVVSQITLSLPLIALYEISILMIKRAERARKKELALAEAGKDDTDPA